MHALLLVAALLFTPADCVPPFDAMRVDVLEWQSPAHYVVVSSQQATAASWWEAVRKLATLPEPTYTPTWKPAREGERVSAVLDWQLAQTAVHWQLTRGGVPVGAVLFAQSDYGWRAVVLNGTQFCGVWVNVLAP